MMCGLIGLGYAWAECCEAYGGLLEWNMCLVSECGLLWLNALEYREVEWTGVCGS